MTQLDIDFARAARDDGIQRSVDHANADAPGWSDLALKFIEVHCGQHLGERFTGLQIREASVAYGLIQPANSKAWGGPIARAARRGWLKRVGTVPDPNRHCNPVPLWEAV